MSKLFEKAYEGDIEGTTAMFTNDPDFFGVTGVRPRFVEYLYTDKDLFPPALLSLCTGHQALKLPDVCSGSDPAAINALYSSSLECPMLSLRWDIAG